MSDKVFIVCVQANRETTELEDKWFRVLGVFSEFCLAEQFAGDQRLSGDWGKYQGIGGEDSEWFLEIYEREVHTKVEPPEPKTQKVEVGLALGHGQWITKTVDVLEVDLERKDMLLTDRAILQAQSELDSKAEVSYSWIYWMASPDDEEENDECKSGRY